MRGNIPHVLDSAGATPVETHFRRTTSTGRIVAQTVWSVEERMRNEIKQMTSHHREKFSISSKSLNEDAEDEDDAEESDEILSLSSSSA